ncbi:MAG: TonB-dependent receptor [Candidatus Marinimicrobia bacterium]|nr:TonB-dependent receptor [Candidatus Neomarinimicrobiota bacterium]MDD5540727.1 TonB-dependent receptor [Candidatus Neomarinimicrobiota bacterium]
MKRQFFIIAISLLLSVSLFAQTGVIRGRVYDKKNNEPLPFVNVIVVNQSIGAATDLDGNFLINGVEPGFYILMASFIGYKIAYSAEIQVNNARSAFVEIGMEQQAIEFQQVEVRPSEFLKKIDAPISVQKIILSDIEKAPGANRDISKVIQSFPGVGATVSYRNDVIVRGGGPNESRFYLDGIEIPNLNHFATQGSSGGSNGILNADFIETVDFYSGAFPANRGNALSGVFDFKQKSGNKERANHRAVLGASEMAYTVDGPLTERTTYLFSVRRSYLKFLFDVIGLPFLPTFNDYQLKTETVFDPNNRLVILSLGALDNNRLNLGIKNPDEQQRYILNYLPESDQWNYMIGAAYTHFRGKSFQTYVLSRNMLSNKSYKYANNDDSAESNKIQDYVSQEIENKFRFENTWRDRGIKITYGVSGEYAKYNNTTYQELYLANSLFVKDYSSDLDLWKYAAFGQISKPFFRDRLTLSVGLRGDGNTYSKSMSNPLAQLSPRFSASYILTEKLNLNFNTGRYYQLPSYTTLGYRDSVGTLVNKFNDLKYISSDHFIGGVEYITGIDTRISAELFYKIYQRYPFSVTDSVSIATKGGDFGTVGDEEVVSTGTGRAYGFEFSGRYRVLQNISGIFSYTYVRSEFENSDGEYIPSSWDSRHILTLTMSKMFKGNWQTGAKWRFVGGSPYTPYDLNKSALVAAWDTQGRPFLDYTRFNRERLGNFFQLDIRIDKSFNFERWSLLVYLDIQNVFNSQAEQPDIVLPVYDASGNPVILNPGDPLDDQRYDLRSIANTTGTILPSIGITVDF